MTLVIVSSEAHDEEARLRAGEEFNLLPAILPQVRLNRGPVRKLRWAFDRHYLNVHGCVASPEDCARVACWLGQYDLVWVLNSRTPNILQQWQWPHSHLDLDDVPSTYLRTISQTGAGTTKRLKTSMQRLLFKRRELLFKERFTTLSVCSEEDRHYLDGGDQIHVIPNGFERPEAEPLRSRATSPPRLGFIGLYTYEPNRQGVRWFLKECWPIIRRQVRGIRFRLVGKGTDGSDRPLDPDVDVLGWMDDPAAEIATWAGMIIPIQFGGGTRIKIADAFSRKCPVVSTRLGAYGYEVEDRRQLRLADDPGSFASACVDLVNEPTAASAMAERAWTEFLEKWTWKAISPKICLAAEDCLRKSFGTLV